MALDPQIPLAAAQQPSFAQQAGQVYQLAGAVEKQKEVQEQRQDQQIIQEALKAGASFDTPDGLAKAAESLKGRVSPKTYQILTQAHQESLQQQAQTREHLSKAGKEEFESYGKKLDFMASNVEEPVNAYNEAKKAGKPEEEATLAFENAKAQKKQQWESMPQINGQPAMPPEIAKQYMEGNPAQFQAKLDGVKSHQENLMAAAKLRKEEQDIKTSAALEGKYKRDKGAGGKQFAGLTDAQNEALGQAVERGLLDPRKLNSRTAGLWADQYIRNPDLDMNRLASDASMMQNATFMQKQLILETLPEIMKNMVDAGKKVNFSDLKLAGKIDMWKKGQLNDPDLQAYMTQRNDAMMTIASVMRGVGMSDKAIEQELQAAPETMSPKALEGWLRGQMAALKPRLRFAAKYTRSDQPGEETNTGKSTGVPHGTLPAKNKQGWSLHKDAKGNKAYVGPKGEVEEVK